MLAAMTLALTRNNATWHSTSRSMPPPRRFRQVFGARVARIRSAITVAGINGQACSGPGSQLDRIQRGRLMETADSGPGRPARPLAAATKTLMAHSLRVSVTTGIMAAADRQSRCHK